MSHIYQLFGLSFRFNAQIDGLIPNLKSNSSDVDVWLQEKPTWLKSALDSPTILHYENSELGENRKPLLRVWRMGRYFRFLYADDTEIILDDTGSHIWADWSDKLTREDTLTYLLGPVLGFVLRLRRIMCLHASAIVIDNQAVAFFGVAGRGKSTTAAAFAQSGFPVLTDDIVALIEKDDTHYVLPSYPRLRLWPDSSEALFGSRSALAPLTPNWDKLYLDLAQSEYKFQQEPAPLAAIYLLAEREDNPQAPYIASVSPRDGLMQLVSNSTVNYLQNNTMRAQEFEVLSQLVSSIPIRQVVPHKNSEYLPQLITTIRDDFRAINQKG